VIGIGMAGTFFKVLDGGRIVICHTAILEP
jgi:hypothetical protein